jgi:flagellin-like protein
MRKSNERAVSPVVGVMLMLVVTIIIAAVVSAFAGGAVSGAKKPPQAEIGAKYSVSTGLQISHNGGDAIPTNQLVFMINDGPTFGAGLDQLTSQMLNKSVIYNTKGDPMLWKDGGYNFSSFNPGDVLYIKAPDTTCNLLQPGIVPGKQSDWAATTNVASDGYTYTSTSKATLWALCIRNNNNIGKSFTLSMMDTQGNMIAKTDVVVSG